MAEPSPEPTPGMPRWVKVFGIVAAVVVLALVIVFIASGGEHGPGRHVPGNNGDETAPPGGHLPPGGDHAPAP